ncbi:hypothetical protein ACFPRL_21895 [Pseudoclavibacter helvolus]
MPPGSGNLPTWMRPRPVRRRTAAARLGGAAPRTGPPPRRCRRWR